MKTALLTTNYFIDNEYLDLYIALCKANLNNKKLKGKTAYHHVIPLSFYMTKYRVSSRREAEKLRKTKETIDYSVNLLYKDHLLAHYYLFQCSTGTYKYKAFSAFKFLVGNLKYNLKIDSTEQLFNFYAFDLEAYPQLYAEGASLHAQAHTGCKQIRTPEWNSKISKSNMGKKKINNGVLEKAVDQQELDKYLATGWQLGVLPYTEERRAKIKQGVNKNKYKYIGKFSGENNPAKRPDVCEKIIKKLSKAVIIEGIYYSSITKALEKLNWSKKKFYNKVKLGEVQYAKN